MFSEIKTLLQMASLYEHLKKTDNKFEDRYIFNSSTSLAYDTTAAAFSVKDTQIPVGAINSLIWTKATGANKIFEITLICKCDNDSLVSTVVQTNSVDYNTQTQFEVMHIGGTNTTLTLEIKFVAKDNEYIFDCIDGDNENNTFASPSVIKMKESSVTKFTKYVKNDHFKVAHAVDIEAQYLNFAKVVIYTYDLNADGTINKTERTCVTELALANIKSGDTIALAGFNKGLSVIFSITNLSGKSSLKSKDVTTIKATPVTYNYYPAGVYFEIYLDEQEYTTKVDVTNGYIDNEVYDLDDEIESLEIKFTYLDAFYIKNINQTTVEIKKTNALTKENSVATITALHSNYELTENSYLNSVAFSSTATEMSSSTIIDSHKTADIVFTEIVYDVNVVGFVQTSTVNSAYIAGNKPGYADYVLERKTVTTGNGSLLASAVKLKSDSDLYRFYKFSHFEIKNISNGTFVKLDTISASSTEYVIHKFKIKPNGEESTLSIAADYPYTNSKNVVIYAVYDALDFKITFKSAENITKKSTYIDGTAVTYATSGAFTTVTITTNYLNKNNLVNLILSTSDTTVLDAPGFYAPSIKQGGIFECDHV